MASHKKGIEPSNEFMKKMSLSNKMPMNKNQKKIQSKSKSIFSKLKEENESD